MANKSDAGLSLKELRAEYAKLSKVCGSPTDDQTFRESMARKLVVTRLIDVAKAAERKADQEEDARIAKARAARKDEDA